MIKHAEQCIENDTKLRIHKDNSGDEHLRLEMLSLQMGVELNLIIHQSDAKQLARAIALACSDTPSSRAR